MSISRTSDPITLLENTFSHQAGLKLKKGACDPKARALGRVYHAIGEGSLTVNGQPPDKAYPLGEYMIHGGRVKFDLRELTDKQRQEFYDYITEDAGVTSRPAATHRFAGMDASGAPKEQRSGLVGLVEDKYNERKGVKKHWGIDLPIGGPGKVLEREGNNKTVVADGRNGHMYIHNDLDNGMLMIGVESSAPHKANIRTGASHSLVGAKSDRSAFMAEKLNKVKPEGKCPLSTKTDTDWATVKINQEVFNHIVTNKLVLDTKEQRDQFRETLRNPHRNAIEVNTQQAQDERMKAMEAWQHTSKLTTKKHGDYNNELAIIKTFQGTLPKDLADVFIASVTAKGEISTVLNPSAIDKYLKSIDDKLAGFKINSENSDPNLKKEVQQLEDDLKGIKTNKGPNPKTDPDEYVVALTKLENKTQFIENKIEMAERPEISIDSAPVYKPPTLVRPNYAAPSPEPKLQQPEADVQAPRLGRS